MIDGAREEPAGHAAPADTANRFPANARVPRLKGAEDAVSASSPVNALGEICSRLDVGLDALARLGSSTGRGRVQTSRRIRADFFSINSGPVRQTGPTLVDIQFPQAMVASHQSLNWMLEPLG